MKELLAKYDTDKETHHHYGDSYDELFSVFDRNAHLKILEIGTQKGWSLIAMKKYFPNAQVSGIDIVDVVEHKRPGIEYIVDDVKNIKDDREYDIVIDDGSHFLEDVLYTVNNFKAKLMVIEDCQNPEQWLSEIRKVKPEAYGIDLRGNYDDYLIVIK